MSGRFSESQARPRRSRRVAAWIGVALALQALSPAMAQRDGRRRADSTFWNTDLSSPPPLSEEMLREVSVEPEVLEIVGRLDSNDYAERESATETLRVKDDWRLQMYALLAGDQITVEQRSRLLQVVRDQLVNTPRGALGIEMDRNAVARGGPLEIRIIDLIAGLPAERVLQIGDRIVAIDDQPLFLEDDLQSRVQSKRPGESVNVTIKRARIDDNGRVVRDERGEAVTDILKLDVTLGSAELLNRQRRDLRVLSNRVQTARQIEADAITQAFAPQPQLVGISGGSQQMLHDNPIDQHAAIINLLAQQELLADRSSDQVRMMREMWQRQLDDLVALSNHPGLTDDERDNMRRVAERFREIMNSEP